MPSFQSQIRSTSISPIFSDGTWRTLIDSPPDNFAGVDYDDSSWPPAFVIGPYATFENNFVPVSQDPFATLFFKGEWIWTTEMNNTARVAPPAVRPFRKKVISPSGQIAVSANISIAVDDKFTFFVNGENIGNTTKHSKIGYFFPNVPLDPSVNIFAISAINIFTPSPNGINPAGVVVGISMVYADDDDAPVSNPTPTVSAPSSSTAGAAASSDSVLETTLSVRTSSTNTTALRFIYL
jgi:hypothetical protein